MNVIKGHLTATEKKHIRAILALDLMEGQINRKSYYLDLKGEVYTVRISQMDRGLIPCYGSPLRLSTRTHQFTL